MMIRLLLALALLSVASVSFAQGTEDPPPLPTITHVVTECGLYNEMTEEVEEIEPGVTYAILTHSIWSTSDDSVYDPDKVDLELISRLHYALPTGRGTITLGQIAYLSEETTGHGSDESGGLQIDDEWECASNFSDEGVILFGEAYYTDRSSGTAVTTKSDYTSAFFPVAQ